ncbi:MAG: hypothetical protein MUE73_11555 [Planctomycetes bacterium]|nr:hypothetical protein [Planctomycetota bacterium]
MTAGRVGILLCVVAFLLTLVSAAWQRLSGPSAPRRGSFEAGGADHRFRLPRTAITGRDLRVAVPDPGNGAAGEIRYRRWPTEDPLTVVPLARGDGALAVDLPTQPAAGKLQYHILLTVRGQEVRVPADPARDPIVRFRGAVSPAILVPHIALMFLAVFFGLLAGLEAAFRPKGMRRSTWAALVTMTLGGLLFGPLVQKAAFGAYWTGFPFGHDLTDNKILFMWFAWVGAVIALRSLPAGRIRIRRVVVLAAAILMFGVYLIPHSTWGSELDWKKHDASS